MGYCPWGHKESDVAEHTWRERRQSQFSIQSCQTLCESDCMDYSTPGFPVHHQLPELAQTHVHRARDAIQPCHSPSFILLLPSIFPSIRVFSNESIIIRWPNYVCTNLITLASSSVKASTVASWYEIILEHLALPPLISGEGNGNPLQYSGLENPMDRGAWWAACPWGHTESDTTEAT